MIMSNPPSPLLRRTSLFPGESLRSLLMRLTQLNHYGSHDIITGLVLSDTKEKQYARRVGLPLFAETYERIETLTGISSRRLYEATAHCFAPVMTPLGQNASSMSLADGTVVPLLVQNVPEKIRTTPRTRTLRGDAAGQFCPHCLKEKAYHRLLWTLVTASICLRHKCLLVSSCHICGKQISIQSIVARECASCKADLRDAHTLGLAEDGLGLFSQRSIQAWLMDRVSLRSDRYSLPEHSPHVLYRFVDGLIFAAAVLADAGSSYIHSPNGGSLNVAMAYRHAWPILTSYQSYCLYATAFKAMVNWPEGFHEFLRAYHLLNNSGDNGYTQMSRFKTIWSAPNWHHPELGFVQDALDQFTFKTYTITPSLLRWKRYAVQLEKFPGAITVLRAARLLQTSQVLIERLIEIDRLKLYGPREGFTIWSTPLYQSEVLELHETWNDTIILEEAGLWLGISQEVAVEMAKLGLFTTDSGQEAWHSDKSRWAATKKDASDCLLRILRNSTFGGGMPSNPVDLETAAAMLSTREMAKARVLKYVVDGRLCSYFPNKSSSSLNSLLFSQSEVQTCLSQENEQLEQEWISYKEVARRMDVRWPRMWKIIVLRWVQAGLLVPAACFDDELYFNRNAVDAFVARYAVTRSITRMFAFRPVETTQLIREGKLMPVSGRKRDKSPVDLFEIKSVVNSLMPNRAE